MENENLKSVKNTLCDIFNRNNPYDDAGQKHNDLMAAIEKNGNSDMSLDEVFALTDNVIKEYYGKDLVTSFSSKNFASPIINFSSYEEMQSYVKSLEISDIEKSLNLQLYDVMLNYDGTNLCEIISNIKSIEDNAIKENKPEDIFSTLTSASVGRYSLAYWNDRMDVEGNVFAKGFWKKLFIGLADAIGAAAGAVAGSATVIAAVAGAIVGGGAASAGFSKAWDLFAE